MAGCLWGYGSLFVKVEGETVDGGEVHRVNEGENMETGETTWPDSGVKSH